MVDETKHEKPLFWIGRSYDDLVACPPEVRQTVGFALGLAQQGGKFIDAKPLKGFGGAGVLVKERLKRAEGHYREWIEEQKKETA